MSESAGLSVLVISCDRYADLWRPFFELFWRHWPDCQGPVYLGSNFTDYSDPRVQTIKVGDDVTWANGVLRMLDRIGGEYVIVLLEDFLLTETVDNARIARLAAIAADERLGCLRLYSIYPPVHRLPAYPELGAFLPGDNWRITAQAAIWRVETLRRLLVPGFSAWDFETIGNQMAEYMPDRIWGVIKPALVYDHAVEKGKWRPQGLAICRRFGVGIDLSQRGAFSEAELQRHEQAGSADARLAERKNAAIGHFKNGQRGQALRDLWWCARQQPASLQLWAIAAAGLAGPGAIALLQKQHVRAKVAGAARAYHRAVASRARTPSAPDADGQTGTSQE